MPVPYSPDESCFGFFGSHGDNQVSDGACTLQISIGEAF